MKKAVVIPVHNKVDSKEVANYRPISIIPTLSKVLEKVLNNGLVDFLKQKNILSKNQFGFRKCLSTEDATVAFTKFVIQKRQEEMLRDLLRLIQGI